MIIDRSYKVSAFGDFSDIVPNTENMMFFLESLKQYDMIPSVYKELKIPNEAGAQPVEQQRIALVKSGGVDSVSIGSNRIDYEIAISEDLKLMPEEIKDINRKMYDVFAIIFEKFEKKASRLALNTQSLVINLTDEDIVRFMSHYTNPISLYNETSLGEWSTRLMVRKSADISEKEEINVITNISKTNLQKNVDGDVFKSIGFSVNVDINSVATNTIQRFRAEDLESFTVIANDWWNIILDEMG